MSIEKLNSYRIILSSKSPRRFKLLKQLGLEIDVDAKNDISEHYPEELKGGEIAGYLAGRKSEAYTKQLNDRDILITADTIVWHRDHILGKPSDENEARAMLRELSDSTHEVFTGVCIRSAKKKRLFVSETTVKFSSISDHDINYYIQQYKPFDKAGAYGIQEWIGYVAGDSINGSYFNVIGLPVQRLYKELMLFIE
ncbi:MAG TPA: septum formation protein Maf [Bacteroidaceae bacterium]|nr:septum formation protein Maf [Bacteroidaceae bacterium]